MNRMTEIISNLMSGDNKLSENASAELQEALKNHETAAMLCAIIVTAPEKEVRLYAVSLLQRFLTQCQWNEMPVEVLRIVRQSMLRALMKEEHESVRKCIVQIVDILLNYETQETEPFVSDILDSIHSYCSSPDSQQSELGASIFAILANSISEKLLPYMNSVYKIFEDALMLIEATGNMTSPVLRNIITGMTELVPFTPGHDVAEQVLQKVVPMILGCLKAFAIQKEQNELMHAFELFEKMADVNSIALNKHVEAVVTFCLEIANNEQWHNALREQAVVYIGWLIQNKTPIIIKLDFVVPIVNGLFALICSEPLDVDNADYFFGHSSPMVVAAQTLDVLALNVPPERTLSALMPLIASALVSSYPLQRRAAFISLAVIAEGCADVIRYQYLEEMLNLVKVAVWDEKPMVHNAALYALAQFSEHLQPDMAKFVPEIIRIFFDTLDAICTIVRSSATHYKSLDCLFYALETFCGSCGDELVPYLPELMEMLFEMMTQGVSMRLRELAFCAVSAVAHATKESMLPFFDYLFAILQSYLEQLENVDLVYLLPQAIDTMAAIARCIGDGNFMPLTTEIMNVAMNLLQTTENSNIRRAAYNLMGSLSKVLKGQMAAVYPIIVEHVLNSALWSNELQKGSGVSTYLHDGSEFDEKEQAILTLTEFAECTGAAFTPYLEKSCWLLFTMIDHPQQCIRKATIDALTEFVISIHAHKNNGEMDDFIACFMAKIVHVISNEKEFPAVQAALMAITTLLKFLKNAVLTSAEAYKNIFDAIFDVLRGKTASQNVFDSQNYAEGKHEELIVAGAGNILPMLGRIMSWNEFAPYFKNAYPMIVQRLEKAYDFRVLHNLRASLYRCLAKCFKALGETCGDFFDELYPIMISGLYDKYEKARQNAALGLGNLVLFSRQKSFAAYPSVLSELSQAMENETNPSALDNMCGAIARMIINNYALVPLEFILPDLLQNLPLRRNFKENGFILRCFSVLYIAAQGPITNSLDEITRIILDTAVRKEFRGDPTSEAALELLKLIARDHPVKLATASRANPEVIALFNNKA